MHLLAMLVACGGGTLSVDDSVPETAAITGDTATIDLPVPVPTGATGDTATAPTGSTGDTALEPPELDCAATSPLPTATLLPGTPVSEEFAFDALGNLVNVDDDLDALLLTPYGGPPAILGPYNAVELAGVAILTDGSYAIAEEWEGAITVTQTSGGRTAVVSGLYQPNSLALGDDGWLYATAFDELRRYDPVTWNGELVATIPGADLDGLVFAPDFSALYVNSDETGFVGRVPFDAVGVPGPVEPVANLPVTWFSELDGMAMDACGNLYVVRTDGFIARVNADGTTETYLQIPGGGAMFTSSLHFGSGIGGWEADHLYVMDRSAGLWEVPVGIPGAVMPHLP